MPRFALLCLLAAYSFSAAQAQLPGGTALDRPRPGVPSPHFNMPSQYEQDKLRWNGPFAPLEGSGDLYRTFALGEPYGAGHDLAPDGTLVGFEVTFHSAGENKAMTSLQAFYLTGTTRAPGKAFGSPVGARVQILAKPGYAVRSIRTGMLGGAIAGIQAVFARIQADGTLSDTDVYDSPAYGDVSTTLDGGGIPLCGVAVTPNRALTGLHLLAAKTKVQALRPALVPGPRRMGVPNPPQPFGGFTPPGGAPAPFMAEGSQPGDGLVAELVRTCGESLIFVEGQQGQGSGFVCMINGKRMLLSNQHVIRGNPNVRFTTLNQTEVKVGTARAAVGHDIISYEVADAVPALELMQNFATNVSVGDPVLVLGNTEGARVIKPLPGRVVGVGPNLVEISSEFLPGNSGSPIIHARSGKVIGIATYAIVRDVNSLTGQREASVRRFGFRIDSVQNWQQVIWPIYQGEAAATRKVGEFSGAIVNLLLDARSGEFEPEKHSDSKLRPAIAHLANLRRAGLTATDRTRMVQNFLGEIRNTSQRDVDDLRPRLRYDYFQRELAEEAKFRTEIYNGLGEAMKKLR